MAPSLTHLLTLFLLICIHSYLGASLLLLMLLRSWWYTRCLSYTTAPQPLWRWPWWSWRHIAYTLTTHRWDSCCSIGRDSGYSFTRYPFTTYHSSASASSRGECCDSFTRKCGDVRTRGGNRVVRCDEWWGGEEVMIGDLKGFDRQWLGDKYTHASC